MFGANIIKEYYVIYFDFTKNKYEVLKYARNRKLTANQRWKLIYNKEFEPTLISNGMATSIKEYENIIKELGLPEERCEMMMTFQS